MLTEYELLIANLIIGAGIAEHLAEEGDLTAFDALDRADLAYFDHEIVQNVMKEDAIAGA